MFILLIFNILLLISFFSILKMFSFSKDIFKRFDFISDISDVIFIRLFFMLLYSSSIDIFLFCKLFIENVIENIKFDIIFNFSFRNNKTLFSNFNCILLSILHSSLLLQLFCFLRFSISFFNLSIISFCVSTNFVSILLLIFLLFISFLISFFLFIFFIGIEYLFLEVLDVLDILDKLLSLFFSVILYVLFLTLKFNILFDDKFFFDLLILFFLFIWIVDKLCTFLFIGEGVFALCKIFIFIFIFLSSLRLLVFFSFFSFNISDNLSSNFSKEVKFKSILLFNLYNFSNLNVANEYFCFFIFPDIIVKFELSSDILDERFDILNLN